MNEDTFKLAIVDEFNLYVEGSETEEDFIHSLKIIVEKAIGWGYEQGYEEAKEQIEEYWKDWAGAGRC